LPPILPVLLLTPSPLPHKGFSIPRSQLFKLPQRGSIDAGGGVGVDTCLPPLAPTYSITGTFDAEDAVLEVTLLPEAEGDGAAKR